jgi:DNA-directed RNA polymerase subunit F
MGHKILDVKADIHEQLEQICYEEYSLNENVVNDILDVVDRCFEKIEQC